MLPREDVFVSNYYFWDFNVFSAKNGKNMHVYSSRSFFFNTLLAPGTTASILLS